MKPFRQGDILFVPIIDLRQIPVGTRSRPRRKTNPDIIVAEGEATGHHHRIRSMNARLQTNGVRTFVRTTGDDVVVSHEEHDDLALPGDSTFEIVHQREHQPARRQRGGTTRRSTRDVWD